MGPKSKWRHWQLCLMIKTNNKKVLIFELEIMEHMPWLCIIPSSLRKQVNLGTFNPYSCGWKGEVGRIRLLDHINYEYSARGQSIQMIICKRPAHPDNHLKEAGPFVWSFARGQSILMIICKIDHMHLSFAVHCLLFVIVYCLSLFVICHCLWFVVVVCCLLAPKVL